MTPSDDSAQGDLVTVRWVCRYTVLRWGGRMRDTCNTEVTSILTRSDYDDGKGSVKCPACGGMLTQRADGCGEVKT